MGQTCPAGRLTPRPGRPESGAMPSLDTLLAFLGISVLVTLAPGPTT
jgi:hypothetical protein